jgi:hypothetical protein
MNLQARTNGLGEQETMLQSDMKQKKLLQCFGALKAEVEKMEQRVIEG